MKKGFIDSLNYYAKVRTLEDKRKLHLLALQEEINRLRERLNVLEKKLKKSYYE